MPRLTSFAFIVLLSALGAQPALASKTKDYNGIECAYSNLTSVNYGTWVPAARGLIGVARATVYCPIDQGVGESYSFDKLAYVIIYGTNITNPRLCRHTLSGSVACGNSTALNCGNWILYKPAGNKYDLPYLSVRVGNSTSLIKNYTAYWND